MKARKSRYPSIGLLNFEGPVLTAHRNDSIIDGGLFLITDQWHSPIAFLGREQFENFILGEFSVLDSSGRAWNYASESDDAKVSLTKLRNFIKPFHIT